MYGYGLLGGRVDGKRGAEARAAYDGHRARRDALARAVRDLGGRPVVSDAAYALPFAVADSPSAVRLAAVLEDRIAGAYADLVRAAEGPRRKEAAGALREAAVRAARWRGGNVAFPGLAERAAGADPAATGPVEAHAARTARADTKNRKGNTRRMGCEPPQRLVRALGEMYGDAAAADWLDALPALTEQALTAGDGLTVERVAAPGGRSSLVVLVRRADGTPAALKIAPPVAGPGLERAALEHWNGWGAVKPLDAPELDASGALLLERLHHEVSLRSLPEAKALLEAAGTLRRLWVEPPAGHAFESVAGRTDRQSAGMRAAAEADPELAPLVDAALAARAELVEGSPELLLLHGNFRQSKVLSGERAPWLTVGPEPLVGERAYDLARLVRDRVEDLIASPGGPVTARRRVKRLAESLEVEQARLHGWTLFRAVESGTRALAEGRRQMGEINLEFAGWL